MESVRFSRGAAIALFALVSACSSSPVVPPRPVTIRVTNATCATGPCAPVRVLAFPSVQPTTPAGLWSIDLGVVDTPSACLEITPSATFRVTDAGTGATTTYTWTSTDAVSLAALPPSSPLLQASPTTPEFVATSAPGWTIELPGHQPPTPGVACRPERSLPD